MMDCKYLNPKADLTFKLVFGEHPNSMPMRSSGMPSSTKRLITMMVSTKVVWKVWLKG